MMLPRTKVFPRPYPAKAVVGRSASLRRLALVLLGGGFLRFVGMGRESIWLDEATSILIARMNLPSVLAWAAADIHPPLYYLTLHFWLILGDSELAVRALSAVLGLLAVVIVYALGRELFDADVGLLSALLLALSPLHIWYSQEARMYAMVATWSLLASYLLVLALRSEQVHYWLGYVLASVLALYTHYFALFVLLFQNVFVLYWLWSNRARHKIWRRWLFAEIAIALLFLPWVPILLRQVAGGGGGWVERSIGRPSTRALLDTWLQFSIGPEGRLYPAVLRRSAYALFAICILAAMLEWFSRHRRVSGGPFRWRFTNGRFTNRPYAQKMASAEGEVAAYGTGLLFCLMYVSLPLLVAWLLSQVKPMYTTRYLLPFLPPYYVIVASGMHALRRNWLRIPIVVFLGAILLVGTWSMWRIEQKDDWRGASKYVVAQAQPGDVALFSPRWNAKPFDYYARQRVEVNLDLPVPTTYSAAQTAISEIGQRYRRVWFFWQPEHYGDRTGIAKQLLDSQYRRVAEKDFRGVGSLTLYELGAR